MLTVIISRVLYGYEGRVRSDGRNWWGLIIFLRAVETQGAQDQALEKVIT